MTNKTTKAKRKALPGVSADALIEAGLLDPFFHLRDPVDIAYEKFLRRFESSESPPQDKAPNTSEDQFSGYETGE
jgi:hypothetical protein